MYNEFGERAEEEEKGELEGLGPFIFLVVLLAVAFVMDMLM